jgi:hypothetical protein
LFHNGIKILLPAKPFASEARLPCLNGQQAHGLR